VSCSSRWSYLTHIDIVSTLCPVPSLRTTATRSSEGFSTCQQVAHEVTAHLDAGVSNRTGVAMFGKKVATVSPPDAVFYAYTYKLFRYAALAGT
jgi:hypothetical protein